MEHKADSNAKIRKAAGALFREEGIRGATVPGIMKRAGLTVGGFYKHFATKTALLHEILTSAMAQTREQLEALPGSGPSWRSAATAAYLSKAHRENPATGCPMPGMATDIAKHDPETRALFEDQLTDIVDTVASRMGTGDERRDREEAWAFVATMVGGLTLARAMKHDATSAEILRACRRQLSR